MSAATLLKAADRCPMPWKNGGGTTQEVMAYPPGAAMDRFLWRVSIAEVAAAGPFSRFDDVDRTLAMISGELALRIGDDGRDVPLDAASPPLQFEGDVAVFGTPARGPAMDLNAMVRRGRFNAAISALVGGDDIDAAGAALLVVALRSVELLHDGRAWLLDPLDALYCPEGTVMIDDETGTQRSAYAVRLWEVNSDKRTSFSQGLIA